MKLHEILRERKETINISDISINNYISTDNMLQDKGGICQAVKLPKGAKTRSFHINDILLSNIRPYFKKIWLANFNGGCSSDVIVLSTKDDKKYNINYIKYFISQDLFFDYVMSGSKGSKMPRGDINHILEYNIKIFNLATQKKIASTLSSLDEKIELNNQINLKLEEMAKKLYDYWFIQFDFPDENGKPYKTSGGKMVYNEILKKQIPEGWEVKKIKEVCTIKYGKNFLNKQLLKTGYNVYGASKIIGKFSEYMYSIPKIIIGCRGSVGKVSYTYGKSFITHNSLILDNLNIEFEYLYYYCLLNNFEFLISGSVQKQLTIENFEDFNILLPEKLIIKKFSNKIKFFIEQIIENEIHSASLTTLRDTLLPLLMNGQLTFKTLTPPINKKEN